MSDGIDTTLEGKHWSYLHDHIVEQQATIANLQDYLHQTIKAYEQLEAAHRYVSHAVPRHR